MTWIETFVMLLFLHALADFSLQTQPMAIGKNRHNEAASKKNWVEVLGREPKAYKKCWFYWLSAHALIQGGLIFLVFGNIWIAIIEIIAHFTLDFIKCEGITNPHIDQACHLIFRIGYSIVLII